MVPQRVREVLRIERGDYIRVRITEVTERQGKKQDRKERKGGEKWRVFSRFG
jgi:hypothetical protein